MSSRTRIYTAITADIVRSRDLPDRRRVQEKLFRTLDHINKKFRNSIVVKFAITVGDEFQGLLKDVKDSYDLCREVQKLLYPVKIVFGVGCGRINTPIYKTTSRMDGECFVYSRESLEKTKDNYPQSIFYHLGSEKNLSAHSESLNAIILLIDTIQSSWRDVHYRRVWLYNDTGTLEAVARREKVSFQMIDKSLKSAHYSEIQRAEGVIRSILRL